VIRVYQSIARIEEEDLALFCISIGTYHHSPYYSQTAIFFRSRDLCVFFKTTAFPLRTGMLFSS
jgi:hypothetical protein